MFDLELSFKRVILNFKEWLIGETIGAPHQRIKIRGYEKFPSRFLVQKWAFRTQSVGAWSELKILVAPKQRLLSFMLDLTYED